MMYPPKVQSSRDLPSWKNMVFNNCSWTLPPWKCLFELIYNFGLHIIPSNDFHNSTGWKIRALVELILKPDNLTGCPCFLGCIHLLHTAEDFMCLHCLQPPHFQAEGSQPAHESCSILLCPFCFPLCQFSYIFLNIRMTRITLHSQKRKGHISVYLFSLFPQKSAF